MQENELISESSLGFSLLGHLDAGDTVLLTVVTDLLIGSICLVLASGLFVGVRRRPEVYYGSLILWFGLFVFAVGVSYLVLAWKTTDIGAPFAAAYHLQQVVNVITAIIGVLAVTRVAHRLPKLTSLRNENELAAVNEKLQIEIKDQRALTAKVQRTEENLITYLRMAPDGMILIEKNGVIKVANEAANKIFGCKPDNLSGRSIEHIMPKRFHDKVRDKYAHLYDVERARAHDIVAELVGVRQDTAVEFPVEYRVNPINSLDKQGEIVLVTVRDVTERVKQQEIDRKELAELAHASRMTTVGQMAAGLAHELNQPLTAISNNLYIARSMMRKQAEPNEPILEMIDENYASAQRAGQIIHSLRQLVSKDDGEKVSRSLNEIAKTTVRLVMAEARSFDVDLELNLYENLPRCLVDTVQIQQVVVNLCRNAIEAIAEHKSTTRVVSVITAQRDQNTLILSVRDSGPGINEEVMPNLFIPYFTSKAKGMGLGLSICRSIVEANGGSLWCDQSSEEGAEFHMTLPIVKGN